MNLNVDISDVYEDKLTIESTQKQMDILRIREKLTKK